MYCETDEDCVDAGDWQMGYYCCYGNNKCCPNAVFCDCPAEANVVLNLSPGPVRIIIEVMLLMHLISAFPILINPPCQYFEQLFSIPSGIYPP